MAKYDDLRREVIDTCLSMNRIGLNQGKSGNVSVRNDDGFLLTASGVNYEDMTPEHVVQMDLEGGYFGPIIPSSEWRMHLDIYRHRREAGAVVHAHSPYATALACLRAEIPAFHYMIGVTGGATLRCAGYARFGTAALSELMLEAMEGRSACLLANHGMICFSDTLAKALDLAVEVEALCRQYTLARQAGEPVILGDDEMAEVLDRFGAYGKQASELGDGELPAFDWPERR